MVAVNFSVFVDKVRRGEKLQTIRLAKCYDRSCDKRTVKRGGMPVCDGCRAPELRYKPFQKLHLFTGLRWKKRAEKLGEATVTSVYFKKGRDFSEAEAILDGFENGYQDEICGIFKRRGVCGDCEGGCTALAKLRRFLELNYGKIDDTCFVVIQWRRE